ncbi:mediator complex subunit MED18, putative [Babesia ovata]|uniref:Mediator complex subunit MED18, putative n=1 Tax=Babesia ovata TaxID=189622 RepID=A0A2H6K9M6_9APIC|nr:mediator complex subunit MED18, putative [Babesia ovata]GBE59691.1 mediator complex subunit MED18, putative [Babesia ovata]
MIPYLAADELGGKRSGAPPPDSDSEAELDAFYNECISVANGETQAQPPKKRYEYVVCGIFRDPSVTANPNPEAEPAKEQAQTPGQTTPPLRMSDPIYQSPLCREFLDTLSHLTETQRVEAIHILTFQRVGDLASGVAMNFTKNAESVRSSTVKVSVHKKPSPLAGKCLIIDADDEKPFSSSADIIVRPIGDAVSSEILLVLPLCGYQVLNRVFISGHVFTNNSGNPSQVEVAVLRHYLDCNPTTPVSQDSLLVEVRCVGDGDPETYKARMREYTQLLYKYVDFALQ